MSNNEEQSPCATSRRVANADGVLKQTRLTSEATVARITVEQIADATQRTGLPIEIDESGWQRDQAVLRHSLAADRTITPIAIRTPPNTTVAKLVQLGVQVKCARYNSALGKLRELRHRIATLVERCALDQNAPLADAHQHFVRLEQHIENRQAERMARGIVAIDILLGEAVFWEHFLEHFDRITVGAERELAR